MKIILTLVLGAMFVVTAANANPPMATQNGSLDAQHGEMTKAMPQPKIPESRPKSEVEPLLYCSPPLVRWCDVIEHCDARGCWQERHCWCVAH